LPNPLLNLNAVRRVAIRTIDSLLVRFKNHERRYLAHLCSGVHRAVTLTWPNGLVALTHGVLYGQRKALFTTLGGVLRFVAAIARSLFGIGAWLQTSLVWLTNLKWVGGACLTFIAAGLSILALERRK